VAFQSTFSLIMLPVPFKKLCRIESRNRGTRKVRFIPGNKVIRPFPFGGCGDYHVLKVVHGEGEGGVYIARGGIAEPQQGDKTDYGFPGLLSVMGTPADNNELNDLENGGFEPPAYRLRIKLHPLG
jgi:hypothetical protein